MKDILTRIDCNFIPVVSIVDSIDWYVTKLGCKIMWHDGGYAALNVTLNNPEDGQANITLGQAMITLVQADAVSPLFFMLDNRKHPMINFYTADIAYTHQTLKDNGVEVSQINDFGPMQGMDFTDNNGHLMGICSF